MFFSTPSPLICTETHLKKANPLTIPSNADANLMDDLFPPVQEYSEILQAIKKLHLDTDTYRLRSIIKSANLQYADYK